jgi:glutamyl-tRNA reductase
MPSTTELHLFGLSFRTAPAAVRAGLAFDSGEVAALLRRAATELPGVEALVLATCNRTECYLAGEGGSALVDRWHQLVRSIRPEAPVLDEGCGRYHDTGEAAVRHLSRVAAGLESAILGDAQILPQLRAAVRLAEEAGTFGRHLHRATATALRGGRRARAETAIGLGAPGVGSAVAETLTARRVTGTVAVLGAGEAARAVGRALRKAGQTDLVFCNRTTGAAAKLAADCGGRTRPWADLGTLVSEAAAVVVATGAREPVLVPGLVGPRQERLVVIDAGFPPQVAPEVARPGVEVTSLEHLRAAAGQVAAQREAAVPAVEAIVEEEVSSWRSWRAGLQVEAAIRALHAEAAVSTREAAEQLAASGALAVADAERIVRASVRRLLHDHVSRLRELTITSEVAA